MAARSKFNRLKGTICTLFLFLALPVMSFSQTVGIFFDSAVPQDSFAANDVRVALVAKGLSPEMLALSSLTSGYANRKVVITQLSNTAVKAIATAQGVTGLPATLGEQAYVLRSVTTPAQSHWIFGGNAVGSMYGGFQITEKIKFSGFAGTYDIQEAPYVKERGEKLNLPFDKRSGTYNGDGITSSASYQAIRNVWDFSFWKEYFDQMARNRFNMVSLWSNSPFTAMTKVADYPLAALQDVQDSAGTVIIRMSIDEKIVFWKKVMAYAKSRGFTFYLFVWNTYLGGAQRAYPTLSEGGSTDPETMDFLYKSMTALVNTYPDFDGFGCTGGENMSGSDDQKGTFFWKSYGKAMYEYLQAHPERTLTYIQRMHQTAIATVKPYFAQFYGLPNARYRASFKYAHCMMYSTPTVNYWQTEGAQSKLTSLNLRTYLTLRNDDLYFCHWGDPEFARAFINNLPSTATYLDGFYIGSDGYHPTRCFHSKDALYRNDLEINRLWYTKMCWGRMSYNPATPIQVFKDNLLYRYPQVDANTLFTAWTNATRAFDIGNAFIRGSYVNDYMYYPESQLSSGGYINFSGANKIVPGSTLTSATVVADSVKKLALAAIGTLNSLNAGGNAELALNIKNLKALALLSAYVGEKIRGKLGGGGQAALQTAYCYWEKYTGLMDEMHVGQQFTRVADVLPNWSALNRNALADAGGTRPTNCDQVATLPAPVISKTPSLRVSALSTSSITLFLPNEKGFSLEIFSSNGAKVTSLSNNKNVTGVSRFVLGKKLTEGVYMVRLKNAGQTMTKHINVCCD